MMEVNIIRKVNLSMDEQKKYEVIKSLTDHFTLILTSKELPLLLAVL